jgi:hypothetical protein
MPQRGKRAAEAPTSTARAHIDHGRALKDDEKSRREDPHGHRLADAADQDEPRGSPNSDRHRSETATSRIRGGKTGRG